MSKGIYFAQLPGFGMTHIFKQAFFYRHRLSWSSCVVDCELMVHPTVFWEGIMPCCHRIAESLAEVILLCPKCQGCFKGKRHSSLQGWGRASQPK